MPIARNLLAALLAAAALAAGAPANKGAIEYGHRIWRMEDGLPQNRIRALTQTPDGYLWIGTAEGLARFDGVRFTVFDRSNTPAFHDDGILALTVAGDGALWVGTEGGGLVRESAGTFRHFGTPEGLTNGFVRAVFEDSQKVLWAGTDRGFFRREGDRFIRLDGAPEIPLATVASIAEDPSGRLWVVSQVGMLTVTNGQLVRDSSVCAAPRPRALQRSGSGPLRGFSATGMSRFVNGCATQDPALPDIPVRSLAEDSEGNFWIGTAGRGLFRFHAGSLISFRADSALPDNTVNAVFEDRERNLWIGCEDGLARLTRTSVETLGSAEGLEDDNVLTVYPDHAGDLWLATLTGQVYRLQGSRVSRYPLPQPAANLQVRTVFQDRGGAFWFGTFGAGAVRVQDGIATVYSKGGGMRSNSVRQILQDASGHIWFALESGLSRWDGAAFRNYYLDEGLSYPSTRCLLEDRRGDILVGTDAGLNRIHDGAIVRDAEFASLKNEKIWAVYQDPGGTLWLGTRGSGLLRFRSGSVVRFARQNGFPSDSVFQILDDNAGRLWMSTSSGVVSVARKSLEGAPSGEQFLAVTLYGAADGMTTSQMNGGLQPAGAKTPAGDMWFPSLKGAVRFDPRSVHPRPALPVLIEKITADSRALPVSSHVLIPTGHGRLQIDFTMCDFITPQRASFRYKLEGLDDSWTPALRTRSATYTNLSPGHYRFRVIAGDPGSPSGVSEADVALTLLPAFYQTRWFYAGLFAAFGALVWAGFAFYARQTRLRYGILLAERTRLAREMHDTVIQGCVGVATLLEAATEYRSTDPAESQRLVDKAKSHVTETLAEAREAVWGLRHTPPPDSAVSMLLDSARKLGSEQNIRIETDVKHAGGPGAESTDPALEHTILLVGQEALRNAVTHAHPTRIAICVTWGESDVKLEVADDGMGFTPDENSAAEARHFGLLDMRERTNEAGGSFAIESGSGSGTRVTAILPRVRRFPDEGP